MKKWVSTAMALLLCLVFTFGTMAINPSEAAAAPRQSKSLSSLAGKIVRECTTSKMSQFEKAIALYDWLIDHTVYKGQTTDAYYVLRNGVASCGGYANAYAALLSKVGIRAKSITGTYGGLGHAWSLVNLGGRWYHVDVRMGDHLKDYEGRYRRFGMSDEQARQLYKFKKTGASTCSYNYAYKTGQLNKAIAYVRDAITTQVKAGDKLFILNLTASGAPSELADPLNRLTVRKVLQNFKCPYLNIPDKAKVTLTLRDNLLLASVKVPSYRIARLTTTIPTNLTVEVTGNDYAGTTPLELGDKIIITPSYATNQKLYWKSYREKTAIVDQSGKVRIVGPGTARIKVSTLDGSKRSYSFVVTVKQK